MKSTKKALFMSCLSLLLCVSMLVGTTFAWFTDSVTSGVNQIIAGNLDVEVKHTNATVTAQTVAGATDLFTDKDGNAMLWEPGAVAYETFTVSNVGTLAFKYNMSLNIADYNAVNEHTLMEVLKVKVLEGSEIQSTVTRDSVAGLDWNTTDTLDVFRVNGGELYPAANTDGEASEEKFQVIVYWQPTDSDNNWNVNNGKTTTDGEPLFIKFGINVVATQLAYESDSFDENYDQSIVLPDLPVSINKTFQSAPIVNAATETVTVKNVSMNTGVATMPAAAANAVIDALTTQATDKQAGTDASTVIYLKVETDATKTNETSVTYNIDFSAIMTYTDTNGETKTTKLQNLDGNMGDQIVTATMNIGKGLSNVNVEHDGTPMNALASETTNNEGYFYNKTTGVLTIKSKSFSPFTVNYDFEGAVRVGETFYTTLEDAVAAAQAGDTVTMVKNLTLTQAVNINKNITLNLEKSTITTNGNMITADGENVTLAVRGEGTVSTPANTQAFAVENNAHVTIYGGTYSAEPAAAFIAENYAVKENANNTWKVVPDYVAYIGEQGFFTVDSALKAVNNQSEQNVTLKITRDVKETLDAEDYFFNKNLTVATDVADGVTLDFVNKGSYLIENLRNGKLVIDEGVNIINLRSVYSGYGTQNNTVTFNGNANLMQFWAYNGGTVTINPTAKVVMGYGDGMMKMRYVSTINVTGNGNDPTNQQLSGGYIDGDKAGVKTLNFKDTYVSTSWVTSNGGKMNLNLDNATLKAVHEAPSSGKISLYGGTITMNSGSKLISGQFLNIGAINIDATGMTGDRILVAECTGNAEMTLESYGTVTVTGGAYHAEVIDNDLYLVADAQ